jgi:hypothetical protein
MMDIQQLEKELLEKNKWLFMKLTEQKALIEKAAQCEHDYRVALAQKMTILRIEGVPVTIMGDLSRGDNVIAKLKLDRDISKGIADACRQSIGAIQAAMSGIQSLISTRRSEMQLL